MNPVQAISFLKSVVRSGEDLDTDDLKRLDKAVEDYQALAESHERLLRVAKMMAGPAPVYENAEQAVRDRLREEDELKESIEQAEQLG